MCTLTQSMWKEVFNSQEGGITETTWHSANGTRQSSGIYAAPQRDLLHPERPGVIEPVVASDDASISAPAELAVLNLGEAQKLKHEFIDSRGARKTALTIHRGKSITFQVKLADQKHSPSLTASGGGAVVLWERMKDGAWEKRPFPFRIPAEQSAGISSAPGRYVLQGTAPGSAP